MSEHTTPSFQNILALFRQTEERVGRAQSPSYVRGEKLQNNILFSFYDRSLIFGIEAAEVNQDKNNKFL